MLVNAALADAKQLKLIRCGAKTHVFVTVLQNCIEMERRVLQYIHKKI